MSIIGSGAMKHEPDEETPAKVNVLDGGVEAAVEMHEGGEEELDEVGSFHANMVALVPRLYVTQTLVAINCLVFVWMVATGVDLVTPEIADLLHWGANYGPKTQGGQWWRLLSSNFLHVGILHIAFNMFVLWDIGKFVERFLGALGFLVVYVISGIFGSLASMWWHPDVVSAGASGAIFGLYGCFLALLLRDKGGIPQGVLRPLAKNAIAFVGFNVVFGMSQEKTDMAAHIGGLAAGFVCGLALSAPITAAGAKLRKQRLPMVAALFVALAVGLVMVGPGPDSDAQGNLAGYERAQYGGDQDVFFGHGASKQDADRLATYLKDKGFFDDTSAKTVMISRQETQWVFSMVIRPEVEKDEKLMEMMRAFGTLLRKDVFSGEELRLRLVDRRFSEISAIESKELSQASAVSPSRKTEAMLVIDVMEIQRSSVFRNLSEVLWDYFKKQGLAEALQRLQPITRVTIEMTALESTAMVVEIKGLDRAGLAKFVRWLEMDSGLSLTREVEAGWGIYGTPETTLAIHWLDEGRFVMAFSVDEANGISPQGRDFLSRAQAARSPALAVIASRLGAESQISLEMREASEGTSEVRGEVRLRMDFGERLVVDGSIASDASGGRALLSYLSAALAKEGAIQYVEPLLSKMKLVEEADGSSQWHGEFGATEFRPLLEKLTQL